MRLTTPSLMLFLLCTSQSFADQIPTDPKPETLLTAEEFDAYATGKTLTYSVGGAVYGAEQYLPDHHVVWAFKDSDCADGIWYEQAGLICFVYANDGTPQCWNFYLGAAGLRAEFVGEGGVSDLSEVAQSQTALTCAGPDVGV